MKKFCTEKPEPLKVAASVTLHKPGKMTAEGRKQVAAWLRKQASHLLKHGEQYNDTGAFRARYYCPDL